MFHYLIDRAGVKIFTVTDPPGHEITLFNKGYQPNAIN